MGVETRIFEEERKKLIVEYININTKATVPELCKQFSVSSATIRNDLRMLAKQGLLKRTHGGAISNRNVNFEQITVEKSVTCIENKRAIAKTAIEYIREGDSIALDAGTTTFEIAKLLTQYQKLTIVTTDLNIATFLENHTENMVIIAGGLIRKGFNYTYGEMAVETLKNMNVDTYFLAANGISTRKGLSTPKMETASVKRVLMKNSGRIILVADSTKIDTISFSSFAQLGEIDVFITDQNANRNFLEEVKAQDVDVVVTGYEHKDGSI